jgi:hypothetical protein
MGDLATRIKDRANLCTRLARAMLGEGADPAILEEQALDLMDAKDSFLNRTAMAMLPAPEAPDTDESASILDVVARAYTPDEVRALLFRHVWGMVDYWNDLEGAKAQRERLSGLAFSIFSMLDGSSIGLPAFDVVCCPHPSDKEYHKDQGENWFPAGESICGGELRHEFNHSDPRDTDG